MALTINDFSGAETKGLEETSAIESTVTVNIFTERSGTYAYKLDSAPSAIEFAPFATVSDAGNDYVVGFGFTITDVTPTVTVRFFSLREGTAEFLALELQTNTSILIKDANDSTIRTITPSLVANTYSFFEVYFQHQASGIVEVFVDGVSEGSDASQDLTDGGTFDTVLFEIPESSPQAFIDDYYLLSGATAASDRLGDCEVFKYQSAKASQTPDDGGANTSAGNWSNAGETPLSTTNTIEYADAGQVGAVDSNAGDGSPEGPKNDARIDGDSNIKAMKGIWHMKRETGGGTEHFGRLGNDVDGTTRSADQDPSVAFANKFMLSEAASVVPLSTQYCRIGIEHVGAGQDYVCAEMWAMLLHVPSTVGAVEFMVATNGLAATGGMIGRQYV